jgi:site-specific DNA recombinase
VLQHKKAMGEVYSPTPYGFDRVGKRLVPSLVEQEVLGRIKALRESGMSLRQIASALNQDGITAKNGGQWYGATIRSVLRTAQRD